MAHINKKSGSHFGEAGFFYRIGVLFREDTMFTERNK